MTFAEKVYDALKKIPKGRVATYAQIAEMIGTQGSARAVGNALHKNPNAPIVPCHRVVAADGKLALNFGGGGAPLQKERLEAEGVECPDFRVDLNRYGIVIESHPLEPFLPRNGRILFLGSFPPPRARWSMEFFYPNWINDFWRIQGLIHFSDSHHFELQGNKSFDRDKIVAFCKERGLAFFDTAKKVCRMKGNASDDFLEIIEPSDVAGMLQAMPQCNTIVTTGGKSSEELQKTLGLVSMPKIGENCEFLLPLPEETRRLRWYRMPSSSRAYPMSLVRKAEYYTKLEY